MQKLDNELDGEDLDPGADDLPAPVGSYRIGGVSRLTGVPVTTLRVWETRHAAFAPSKSTGRHRLYTEVDVMRARLLRQLSASGHSVSGIARLPLSDLQRLLTGSSAPAAAATAVQPRPVSLVVVGEAVAARVNAPAWRQRHLGEGMEVREVYADLRSVADAAAAGERRPADILVVRLNAIQVDTAGQLRRAVAQLQVNHAIVLYNFAAEPVLETLRVQGMILRREPVSDAELAEAIRSVMVLDPADAAPAFGPGATIPRRRYSDAMLARVASEPSTIVCECPRHIADLIGQLAAFEEYSAQCLNTSPEDAHVHASLRSISGSARALFEHALHMVLQHGGVPIEPDLPAAGS